MKSRAFKAGVCRWLIWISVMTAIDVAGALTALRLTFSSICMCAVLMLMSIVGGSMAALSVTHSMHLWP